MGLEQQAHSGKGASTSIRDARHENVGRMHQVTASGCLHHQGLGFMLRRRCPPIPTKPRVSRRCPGISEYLSRLGARLRRTNEGLTVALQSACCSSTGSKSTSIPSTCWRRRASRYANNRRGAPVLRSPARTHHAARHPRLSACSAQVGRHRGARRHRSRPGNIGCITPPRTRDRASLGCHPSSFSTGRMAWTVRFAHSCMCFMRRMTR